MLPDRVLHHKCVWSSVGHFAYKSVKNGTRQWLAKYILVPKCYPSDEIHSKPFFLDEPRRRRMQLYKIFLFYPRVT